MASKITIKEISIFKVHNRPTKDLILHVSIEHTRTFIYVLIILTDIITILL